VALMFITESKFMSGLEVKTGGFDERGRVRPFLLTLIRFAAEQGLLTVFREFESR